MKKVYGYIRVSTAKQGEGVSLEVQKEAIIRYASQYQLDIIEWFEEKETAAKQGRPLFTKMMKLVREKKADGIIMHKIDRSARNLKDWADLGNLIDEGVDVHFAHESLDLHARGGRLSADIQAVIAADYIRNLRQETIKGIYGRLNQGIYPFGAPIGYLDAGKGKCKIIDPAVAPWIKETFELYAKGKHTLRTLAQYNRELGLGKIKKPLVTKTGLSTILNNPFYMGIMKVKGTHFNGKHEPLVSTILFERVQRILNNKTNATGYKHNYKFRRLLSCMHCGYSLVAEKQKGHIYYRCHTINCSTKCIKEVELDELLLDTLEKTQLLSEEVAVFSEILDKTEQDWQTKQEQLSVATRLQTYQVKSNLERLTDCYIEGGIDRDTYEERKGGLLVHLKKMEEVQRQLLKETGQILPKMKNFLELAKSLIDSYKMGNMDEQRNLLDICTSNLAVAGKNLIVSMKSPYLELSERWNLYIGSPEWDNSRTKMLSRQQLEELFQLILKIVASKD